MEKKLTQEQLHTRTWWVFVIVWMAIIFCFSAQNADLSKNMSDGIVDVVARVLVGFTHKIPGISGLINVTQLSFIIRKMAHAFSYMVLALLLNQVMMYQVPRQSQRIITVLMLCALYACTDEVHQRFVPGRSGEIRDVLVDSGGATIGILITYVGYRLFHKNLSLQSQQESVGQDHHV